VPFILCCLILLALFAGGCMLAKNIFFPETILNAGEEEESQPVQHFLTPSLLFILLFFQTKKTPVGVSRTAATPLTG
jgi:hypothetical protein